MMRYYSAILKIRSAMKLMFVGPPGAGKGTQAAWSSGVAYTVAFTGDMLREEIKNGTQLGTKAVIY